MKRNLKVLVLLPIFALAACGGLGKEADAQAVAKYQEEMAKVEEAKNITFSVEMNGKTGADHQATKAAYKMKQAENGDLYYYTYQKQGKTEAKMELYQVKNEKYEEVTYIKIVSGGQSAALAYAKKDNATYDDSIADYVTSAGMAPAMFYMMLASPEGALELMEADEENMEFKYYSTGEKNLSVKAEVKNGQPVEDEDEYATSGSMTITYNDYRFSSVSISSKTNLGNSASVSGSASYGKVSIGLPSGWEKAIVK